MMKMSSALVPVLPDHTKSWQKQLKKGRCVGLMIWVHSDGEGKTIELEAAGQMSCASKQREVHAGAQLTFYFLFCPGPQPLGQCCPHLGCIFSLHVTLSGNFLGIMFPWWFWVPSSWRPTTTFSKLRTNGSLPMVLRSEILGLKRWLGS